MPPIEIAKGYQVISGMTQKILCDEAFITKNKSFFNEFEQKPFNQLNFHNLDRFFMKDIKNQINEHNIFLFDQNLKQLSFEESFLVIELLNLRLNLPHSVNRAL